MSRECTAAPSFALRSPPSPSHALRRPLAHWQVYFSQDPPTATVRYGRALLCFGKAAITAHSPGTAVTVSCDAGDTLWFDAARGDYAVYAGNYTLYVGLSSADPAALTEHFAVAGGW